jgi:hypothetical protein
VKFQIQQELGAKPKNRKGAKESNYARWANRMVSAHSPFGYCGGVFRRSARRVCANTRLAITYRLRSQGEGSYRRQSRPFSKKRMARACRCHLEIWRRDGTNLPAADRQRRSLIVRSAAIVEERAFDGRRDPDSSGLGNSKPRNNPQRPTNRHKVFQKGNHEVWCPERLHQPRARLVSTVRARERTHDPQHRAEDNSFSLGRSDARTTQPTQQDRKIRAISSGGAVRLGVFGSLSVTSSTNANSVNRATAGTVPIHERGLGTFSQPKYAAQAVRWRG